MPFVRRVGLLSMTTLLALCPAASCKNNSGGSWSLPAIDLVPAAASFQADDIIYDAQMEDANALDADQIESFLQATPYGGASFLSDYASNGVTASQAIAATAQQYTLNPIALLVRAEMDQGLVSSEGYPSPSSRVEYAFGCGCTAPGNCDPTYAGFNIQIACFAAAIRESINEVVAIGHTDGGWYDSAWADTHNTTAQPSETLDGVSVTPFSASTAALYQYTPIVAVQAPGGNWLFWNLWTGFTSVLSYTAPADAGMVATAWIGDPCVGDGICVYGGTSGTCATQYTGGLCTLACNGSCPSSSTEPAAACVTASIAGSTSGSCLVTCNTDNSQCRSGYTCMSESTVGSTAGSANVCVPN